MNNHAQITSETTLAALTAELSQTDQQLQQARDAFFKVAVRAHSYAATIARITRVLKEHRAGVQAGNVTAAALYDAVVAALSEPIPNHSTEDGPLSSA